MTSSDPEKAMALVLSAGINNWPASLCSTHEKVRRVIFQFFNLFPIQIQTLKIQFVSIYFRSQYPFSFPFHTHSVVHNLDYFLYFVNEYFRIEKYFDFGTDHFLFHAKLVDVKSVSRRLHCIL